MTTALPNVIFSNLMQMVMALLMSVILNLDVVVEDSISVNRNAN